MRKYYIIIIVLLCFKTNINFAGVIRYANKNISNSIQNRDSIYNYFKLYNDYKIDSIGTCNIFVDKWIEYYFKNNGIIDHFSISEWELFFEKELGMASISKDKKLEVKISFPLAVLYHTQEKFSKAKILFEVIYNNGFNGNSEIYKSTLIKLEECYRSEKNLKKSIEIRKVRIENKYINSFWEIYRDFYLFDLAIEDFNVNEVKPKKNGIKLLRYYMYLGDMYLMNNEIDSARLIFKNGLQYTNSLIHENSNILKIPKEYTNFYLGYFNGKIAKCNIEIGNYKESIPSLIYNNTLNSEDLTNQRFVWSALAECYIGIKEKNKAFNSILNIRRLSNLTKYDSSYYLKIMYSYYEMIEKLDSSIYYLKLYQQYTSASLLKNIENKSTVLLIKYETEKLNNKIKNQNIKYENLFILFIWSIIILILVVYFYFTKIQYSKKLQNVNLDLKLMTDELSISDKNKNILLKELNHRVKNNLQLIISFMNIKLNEYENNSKIYDFVEEIQNRIMVISSIYENIYKTDSYEKIYLNKILPEIITRLESLYKLHNTSFQIQYIIDPIVVTSNHSLFISLIMNEAISNSVKHAFNNSSSNNIINIEIVSIGTNEFQFTISDNGSSFDISSRNNGFGLNFIKLISQQLNSEYFLDYSNGVIHRLILKI